MCVVECAHGRVCSHARVTTLARDVARALGGGARIKHHSVETPPISTFCLVEKNPLLLQQQNNRTDKAITNISE